MSHYFIKIACMYQ